MTGSNLKFPIIADPDRKVSYLYDMIDYQDTTNIDEKGELERRSAPMRSIPDS